MPISFYMDHHIPKAITVGLRLRGVDVITAHEDGADQLSDDLLLKRAHIFSPNLSLVSPKTDKKWH